MLYLMIALLILLDSHTTALQYPEGKIYSKAENRARIHDRRDRRKETNRRSKDHMTVERTERRYGVGLV